MSPHGIPGSSPKYRGKDGPRTSAVLARILDAEGFSDYAANQVEGYWRRSSVEKDLAEVERLRVGIGELTKTMTPEQKQILGKFVGLHQKMGFDTGLRMGLAVRLVRDHPGSA